MLSGLRLLMLVCAQVATSLRALRLETLESHSGGAHCGHLCVLGYAHLLLQEHVQWSQGARWHAHVMLAQSVGAAALHAFARSESVLALQRPELRL